MIISGLIGGAVATLLGVLSLRTQKGAQTDHNGWKRLRPGWHLHFLVLGCLAFVAVIAIFFWLGGSARADAFEQNLWALGLMVAFGAAGIGVYCAAYLRKIEWRGNSIRVRAPWRREVRYRFADIVNIKESAHGAEHKIRFADGGKLSFNVYFNGYHDLVEDLGTQLSESRSSQ